MLIDVYIESYGHIYMISSWASSTTFVVDVEIGFLSFPEID